MLDIIAMAGLGLMAAIVYVLVHQAKHGIRALDDREDDNED